MVQCTYSIVDPFLRFHSLSLLIFFFFLLFSLSPESIRSLHATFYITAGVIHDISIVTKYKFAYV